MRIRRSKGHTLIKPKREKEITKQDKVKEKKMGNDEQKTESVKEEINQREVLHGKMTQKDLLADKIQLNPQRFR